MDAIGAFSVESATHKTFLVSLSSDAGACAPKLEIDLARLQLVGSALGPVPYEELERRLADGTANAICEPLNSSMMEVIVQ